MLYLFDIDGTLLLTGGAGSRALATAFERRFGLARAMDGVKLGGRTDPMIIEEVFERHLGRGPTEAEAAAVIDEYLPLLDLELAKDTRFRLMPSVIEALDHLAAQAGVVLGVATGNVRPAARAKLERGGLWQRFAHGGFGCDHRDRAMLVERAIERARTGEPPVAADATVVVVGDTPFDVAAARACGALAVAVATGSFTRSELADCLPDALFDTLAELPAWHARISSPGDAHA